MMRFTVNCKCPTCGKEFRIQRIKPASRVVSKKCKQCKYVEPSVEKTVECGATEERGCHNCIFFYRDSDRGNKYWKPCLKGVAATMTDGDGKTITEPDLVYIGDVCNNWSEDG